MLVHAKKIIGLPVIEAISGTKIDFIKNIIIDPESGRLEALLIKKRYPWQKTRIVSFKDVSQFYADGVLVKNPECIVVASEVFKANDILKKKILLIGSSVLTQNGQKLGFLEDFIFDTTFCGLLTLIVKKSFSSERRIISAERILSILRKKIIIRDAIIKAAVEKKLGAFAKLLNSAAR
jgi:uncharacterized protein YrrD